MATDKPRFSVTFTDDLYEKIHKYQKENNISTQSKAVARLVELALDAIGFFPEQEKSPSTDESAPGEKQAEPDPLRSSLLHNFDQLNQEGRERLVETSDDMVSSGKYIKSGSFKMGGEKLA